MRKLFHFLLPPPKWRTPVIILCAIFTGCAGYGLYLSNALSYLSDKPETCLNCHVMGTQYATWRHSSHANVATCNDCHVPQDSVVKKYFFKAKDGLRHSTIFTLGLEDQVIEIKEEGTEVVQANCIRCHSKRIDETDLVTHDMTSIHSGDGRLCWDCHREVPHGRVRSLSSTPNSYIPNIESPVPSWLKEDLNKEKKSKEK